MWHTTPYGTLFIRKIHQCPHAWNFGFYGSHMLYCFVSCSFFACQNVFILQRVTWAVLCFFLHTYCISVVSVPARFSLNTFYKIYLGNIHRIDLLINKKFAEPVYVKLSAVRQKHFGYEILSPVAGNKEKVSLFLL